MIDESLKHYIQTSILPLYDNFDAAHQHNHVDMVIELSMVYAIAAYHDTGLRADRKTHHLVSGRIIRADMSLREWISEAQIETMAQACENHRASIKDESQLHEKFDNLYRTLANLI